MRITSVLPNKCAYCNIVSGAELTAEDLGKVLEAAAKANKTISPEQIAQDIVQVREVFNSKGKKSYQLMERGNAYTDNLYTDKWYSSKQQAQAVANAINSKRAQEAGVSDAWDAAVQQAIRGETATTPTQTAQAANTQNRQTASPTQNTGAQDVITGAEANKNASANAETESTAVNDNPTVHTPQEQAIIEAYKSSVDDNLVQYYEKYKTQDQAQKVAPYILEPVNNKTASDIEREIGVDVHGFDTKLDAKQINHIYRDHGENGKSDHSMADANDLGRIQYVLDTYDDVVAWGRTDAYNEPNGRGGTRTAKTVRFSKKVNGTYYVVEAAPNTKAKSLYVVSAYMLEPGKTPYGNAKKIKSRGVSQPSDALQPRRDGLTASGINPLDVSTVPQSSQSVKQNVSANNDMGAMRSQFDSQRKQSKTQSNTINAFEEQQNVPEAQRTPLYYDTISEKQSLNNARMRLAQDYAGEMAELRGKHNWSGEEVDMGMTILDNYRRAAEESGDWTEYSKWREEVQRHGTEAGQALQAYAKYSRQTGGILCPCAFYDKHALIHFQDFLSEIFTLEVFSTVCRTILFQDLSE